MLLAVSLLLVTGFQIIINNLPGFNLPDKQAGLVKTILNSWFNLAFTASLSVLFLLLYISFQKGRLFRYFATYGRMSLSNYLMQTIIGVFFFYGNGLAMYRLMGYTWGLLYGLLFFIMQVALGTFWLKRFHYGLAEWLWRAFTFFDFGLMFRRR